MKMKASLDVNTAGGQLQSSDDQLCYVSTALGISLLPSQLIEASPLVQKDLFPCNFSDWTSPYHEGFSVPDLTSIGFDEMGVLQQCEGNKLRPLDQSKEESFNLQLGLQGPFSRPHTDDASVDERARIASCWLESDEDYSVENVDENPKQSSCSWSKIYPFQAFTPARAARLELDDDAVTDALFSGPLEA
jgi:hypothetical protein